VASAVDGFEVEKWMATSFTATALR